MKQYLRHLILLTLLLSSAGNAEDTVFGDLRIEPAVGRYYRPGNWVMVRVSGYAPPGFDALCVPELHLVQRGEEMPLFISRQPVIRLQEGDFFSFQFWVISGAIPPRLQFVLATPSSLLRSRIFADWLTPLAPGERLCLSIAGSNPPVPGGKSEMIHDIPDEAVLYASCDLLTLGSINRRKSRLRLKKSQITAIEEWARRGGIILVFDKGLGDQLDQELSFTTPLFPFTLPIHRLEEVRPSPPPARRMGRGLIVYPTSGSFSQRGLAVWKRLKSEYLSTRRDDSRLAGPRYDQLGLRWPPPGPSAAKTGKWLLVWLFACFALLLLPAVRRKSWLAAVTVVVVSMIMAYFFVRNNPLSTAQVVHVQVRTVGATGAGGPSQDEQLWIATPFGNTNGRLTIPFRGWPPPVLLAYSNNELMNTAVTLTADSNNNDGGIIGISERGRGIPAVRRGVPLLFSQISTGEPVSRQQRRLVTSRDGVEVGSPGPSSPPLYDVLLIAREEKQVTLPVWERGMSGVFPWHEYEALSPRQKIMQMLAAENKPGSYATLMGWEENHPKGNDLGVLQIHGFTHVVNE